MVFEDFVRNFFRSEQTEFSVRSEIIKWHVTAAEPHSISYLPEMVTDISLRSPSRTIIIDTKYYRQTLSSNWGSEKIRSAHLYQLFAYLKNLEPRGGTDASAAGVLLYPTVGQNLDLHYVLGGHHVRIKTLDLNVHWKRIHAELLGIIGDAEFVIGA